MLKNTKNIFLRYFKEIEDHYSDIRSSYYSSVYLISHKCYINFSVASDVSILWEFFEIIFNTVEELIFLCNENYYRSKRHQFFFTFEIKLSPTFLSETTYFQNFPSLIF